VYAAARRKIDLPKGATFVQVGDLSSDNDWRTTLSGIDTLIHTAARVQMMRDTVSDPLTEFRHVNVKGTVNLARQAASAGVRRFIFISSVKVNGEESPKPYSESDAPAPQDAYGISKWEAEQALRGVEKETGREGVVIRPPLVYGPGVKANFLSLIRAVNRGIPLPIAGIMNKRSLLFLGNLIDAIVTCIDRKEAAGKTYLVSDGEDVSTPELVRRMGDALGRKAWLLPAPQGLMRLAGRLLGKTSAVDRLLGSLTVDISRIRSELNWSPPYTMEQGLKETAEWFKNSF